MGVKVVSFVKITFKRISGKRAQPDLNLPKTNWNFKVSTKQFKLEKCSPEKEKNTENAFACEKLALLRVVPRDNPFFFVCTEPEKGVCFCPGPMIVNTQLLLLLYCCAVVVIVEARHDFFLFACAKCCSCDRKCFDFIGAEIMFCTVYCFATGRMKFMLWRGVDDIALKKAFVVLINFHELKVPKNFELCNKFVLI